jgi:multimeric flavodoxin WrbA
MAEIYEKRVAAHGVIILTPTYWYQAPSVLKLMIDRLVCADGGNPDPTSTHGKKQRKPRNWNSKAGTIPSIWLAARGLVVHGDVAGGKACGATCRTGWTGWGSSTRKASALDRYLGYYESYAESHQNLDQEVQFQQEVRNVARSVAAAVGKLRSGWLSKPDAAITPVRPK